MDVESMRRKDFLALPVMDTYEEEIGPYSSLVIIPTLRKRDSGWRIMWFVPVDYDGEPICLIQGYSDRLDLYEKCERTHERFWRIDCLPCGYLRVWCTGGMSGCTPLSEFEVRHACEVETTR